MLGERLAASRKQAGLMQADLAAALGKRYDQSVISKVERNISALLADGLVKAAETLHVSVDYLTGLTDDPTPAAELRNQLNKQNAKPPLINDLEAPKSVIGERLAASRKRAGMRQVELAVALGERYDQSVVSAVEHNRSSLRIDGLTRAAHALGVSVDYLVGLADDPTPSVEREETLDQLRTQVDELSAKPLPEPAFPAAELLHQEADPELAWVGKYGVLGSAGPGAFVDSEHVVKQIGFRRDWLRKKGLNPAKCSVIDVHGHSMEPTLHHGAMILIDHQRARRLENRIFAVRSDDGPLIKRLMHDNHHWLLVSDNKEYKPVKWPREAVVIGQVMWTGRTL